MSYATYLSNRTAQQQKIVRVQRPTDASHYIHKQKQKAAVFFPVDGQDLGTLRIDTDRPTPSHPAISFPKKTIRPADASTYTTYRGSQGIRTDEPYRAGGVKELPCCEIPLPDPTHYKTASDATRDLGCPERQLRKDGQDNRPQFVDNTVRLSAMNSRCVPDANHTKSEGLPYCPQEYAVTQHTFMAAPPEFQNKGVGGRRAGAYYNPRSGYVEKKHGYVAPTKQPLAPFRPSYPIEHLKINRPTLFNIKAP